MAAAARQRFGRHAGQGPGHDQAGVAALPACVHPDEPARHRRPHARRPRRGGPAVLPHRRRQDRSVPGPGGLHPGPAAAGEPGHRLGRPERAHAVHAAALDPGPAQPRGHADLRPGVGAAEGRGEAGRVALRDRPVGRPGGHAEPMGSKGDGDSVFGPGQDHRLPERRPQAVADPAGGMPLVRREVQGQLLPTPAQPRQPDRPAGAVHEPPLRVHPRPAAADPGRGRADLPPAALLYDRHGGQVRRHAVDRRGRRVLRPGQPLRQGGLLRPVRADRRRSRCPAAGCCRRTW